MNIEQNRDQRFDPWYNAGSFEANRQGAGNTYAEEISARLGVEAPHGASRRGAKAECGNYNITVIMFNTGPDNLGALLSDWLKSGRRSSPNTAESYRRNILDFMRFCAKAPADVTVADVVSYQAHLRQNYKASSESQKLASIRSFFKFLKTGKVI